MRLTRKDLLCVYRFSNRTPSLAPLPNGYEYIRLECGTTIQRWFGGRPDDRRRLETYMRLAEDGFIGMGIVFDGGWAHTGWIAPPGLAPPHLTRRIIGEGHVWTFGVHTRPDFRGQGLQKAGLTFRLRVAREAVRDENASVMTDVAPMNTPSRRAKLRIGFQPAGMLSTTTLKLSRNIAVRFGTWDRKAEHPSLLGGATENAGTTEHA